MVHSQILDVQTSDAQPVKYNTQILQNPPPQTLNFLILLVPSISDKGFSARIRNLYLLYLRSLSACMVCNKY
jgi:hypothetical protein